MPSIYQRALGDEFSKLHPMIQKRFGFSSEDKVASIGKGVMKKVWHGAFYTLPFLYIGTWRSIMFPEQAENVEFTIENYAYRDRFGRETVTWLRTFNTSRRRRFDAYMVYSEERGRIVDYLGTHQHLAVDLEMRPNSNGGMAIRSGEQRFYEGPLAFRFPMLFSGVAEVRESFNDSLQQFEISVRVVNRFWGPLFGYNGTFHAEWMPVGNHIPERVKPVREERRE